MKLSKLGVLASAILGGFWVNGASAELSGNIGVVSQYYFRGFQQTDSASASAGIDYESGGFYAGTWLADVGNSDDAGLEVDFYAGYGGEVGDGVSWSVGVTTYQYTGKSFDSAYNEINLGAGFGIFSLEVSLGTHDDDDDLEIAEQDYMFVGVTVENNGFYGTLGMVDFDESSNGADDDFSGEYIEVGYGTEIGGFDTGIALIVSSKELDFDDDQQGNESIVFSLGKSFDL